MICDRCKLSVPIPDINYVPKGKDAIMALCVSCRIKKKDAEKEVKITQQDKKPYYCYGCRYKFSFDAKGVSNLKCPYCGSGDKVGEYKPPSADKLLNEFSGVPK